jgi:hypothetical protein
MSSFRSNRLSTDHNQETLGLMLGKLMGVWTAVFVGLSLKDALQIAVLLATLIYTVAQTWILFRDKILKPKRVRKEPKSDTTPMGLGD